CRVTLGAGLGDEVLFVAGQAREPVQNRQRLVFAFGLRRQVDGKTHVAAEDIRAVPPDFLPAAETGAAFDTFHDRAPTGSEVSIATLPLPRQTGTAGSAA